MVAWNESSHQIDLKGPRHRAVLARLVVARGRVVPVDVIVDDLWVDPPSGATSAIRTFVSALRRALEPDRAPRKKPKVIVTEGPGYAFHAAPDAVDAWEFERLVREAADSTPAQSLELLRTALQLWRGPAYAEFADEPWARTERSRLEELRLTAVERLASAQLDLGRAAEAIPDLDAHVTEHPWREEGWRLLALALYRSDRQGDALAVLRRARKLLAEELGIDPGPRLNDLESDILRRETRLDPVGAEQIFSQVSAAYDRTVAAGSKSRLESTVGLLRSLAVAGGSGLETARNQRLTIIAPLNNWTTSNSPRGSSAITTCPGSGRDPTILGRLRRSSRPLSALSIDFRPATNPLGRDCWRQSHSNRADCPVITVSNVPVPQYRSVALSTIQGSWPSL